MLYFILNDKEIATSLQPGMTLLDFIRYQQKLTGTKIGCREGDCGACTVLVGEIKDGELVYTSATSCLMALGNAQGKHIVTVEGINIEGLNAVQQAFAEEGATQCGFCTPGFIVSLTGYCMRSETPSYHRAIDAMNGNICRCTGYKSIERAANAITQKLEERNNQPALQFAIEQKMIPAYFLTIKERLQQIPQQESSGTLAAKKLGGGTDLYVQQHDVMEHAAIDFLFDKIALNGISQEGNTCKMGGAVTAADISDSPIFKKHFKQLDEYIKLVSSTQIRNMATIAGNFTNASPIGDFTIFFLALDAQLTLSGSSQKRQLPLRDLYLGYKQLNKTEDEIIENINFELPGDDDHFSFEKVCKRTNLDIASVNSALYLKMNGDTIVKAGLSAGGVGPIPAYLPKSSAYLIGQTVSFELINELIGIIQIEISPISDVRGTESYKRLLLAQLVKAHFIKMFPAIPVEKLLSIA